MFQNILYPFDGIERCMSASTQILELVKRVRAQLTVLYVHRRHPYDKVVFEQLWTRLTDGLRDCDDVPVPIFPLVEGNANAEILRYADNNGVDLIAMPAGGRTEFERLFHRSTTSVVAQHAACAVWTIAGNARPLAQTLKIVCAVDESRAAHLIVQNAEYLARSLQAHLTLAYAVPELNEGTLARMSQDPPFLSTGMARKYLHRLAQSVGSYADCTAEIGSEPEVFVRIAMDTQADLLILDRSLHGRMPNLAGALQRAGCGMLLTDFGAKPLQRTNTITESAKILTFSN